MDKNKIFYLLIFRYTVLYKDTHGLYLNLKVKAQEKKNKISCR